MDIFERIKAKLERLTEADRKVIDTLLNNRAETVFLSGPQLAERANVHEATTTRLAQKLGYKGYPEMRGQLQREVMGRQDAADRMRRTVSQVEHGAYLSDLIANEIAALTLLQQSIAQDEIDRAAEMIVNARHVFVFAQGHALSVATFLRRRLDRFGMTTVLLTGRGRDIAERIVGMQADDVLVAFALRKQPAGYAPLAEFTASAGAKSLLISDLVGPMMQPEVSLMLAASRGRSGNEFQTPTIPLAIVSGILLTIAGRHQKHMIGKLDKLSELFERFE